MVDTLVLSIPWESYRITNADLFSPSARPLLRQVDNKDFGSRAWTKYIQNYSRSKIVELGYRPRLTIYRRYRQGYVTPLKIEFSAPKLIYGNNLKEVSENDFTRVIGRLQEVLPDMGIDISREALTNASISAIHYCKNFHLTGGYTAKQAIRIIAKLDFSKRVDHNKRDFRNDGQALYLHCNTYQLVLYDKMSDLRQPSKRSLDYHQNDCQIRIFDNPKEVLRWEIRLTNKAKIKSVLKKLNYNHEEITLKNLFNQKLASKVMQDYWDQLYQPNAQLLLSNIEESEIFEQLLNKNSLDYSLKATALVTLASKVGMRGLRSIIESKHSTRTWYRIKDQINLISTQIETPDKHEIINTIEKELCILK